MVNCRFVVRASDPDYGLRYVTLQAEREGQQGQEGQKLGLPVLLDRPKPDKAWPGLFTSRPYFFRPAELNLKAGDVVHYWATAEDNKEPRPNHSETGHQTIRIIGAGQSSLQNPEKQPNGADGQQGENPDQAAGQRDKTEPGKGDSPSKADGSKDGDHGSGEKSKNAGKDDNKSQDPQPNGDKDRGQPDGSGGPGKEKASSDPSKNQKGGEPVPVRPAMSPRSSIPKRRKPTPSRRCLKIERSKRRINKANPISPGAISSKSRIRIPTSRAIPSKTARSKTARSKTVRSKTVRSKTASSKAASNPRIIRAKRKTRANIGKPAKPGRETRLRTEPIRSAAVRQPG